MDVKITITVTANYLNLTSSEVASLRSHLEGEIQYAVSRGLLDWDHFHPEEYRINVATTNLK